MSMVMFQFRHAGGQPTLEQIRQAYGLRPDQVDPEYGVVETDSREGLFVVLVDDGAQRQIEDKLKERGAAGDPAVGVFANPPVEPFGPPEGSDQSG